jgi:ribosome maturation factor RimP
MALTDLSRMLEEKLEPIAEEHGFELVAVEQAGGRRAPVIRVLLDREGGVDLDAICSANAWVTEAIDALDPMSGPYTLEVSSPGVDRPLRKREDFARFAGENVTVKTKPHGQGRSVWTGRLVGLEEDDVVLDVDAEMVRIPFESVQKARLKGVVNFNRERGAE